MNCFAFPVPAASMLPHAAPMCCIDTLESVHDAGGEARVLFTPGHILLSEGALEPAGFIELVAQTAGAAYGCLCLQRGLPVRPGFLAGVRDFAVLAKARQGDTLTVRTTVVAEVGDVMLVQGLVYRGEELLAQGELKVYVHPEN